VELSMFASPYPSFEGKGVGVRDVDSGCCVLCGRYAGVWSLVYERFRTSL